MSSDRPLQMLSNLNGNLDGSMLSMCERSKRKRKTSFGDCLDAENTPQELIQHCSPLHKQRGPSSRGKENEDTLFILARRPRRRKEPAGLSWERLPEELLLGIFTSLCLKELLRASRVCKRWHRLAFDESLWHSVDLVGKTHVDAALPRVLSAGVLTVRCPRTCIGELCFPVARQLRVRHLDLSSCLVSAVVLEDIISHCHHLQDLSLEGMELSDNVIKYVAQNHDLVRLNLCGCSGFSALVLGEMLQSCSRLEELNISWCDFDSDCVKAVVANIPSTVTQLNISGYRENLNMDDVKCLIERCKDLTHFDLSDSTLVTADSFPLLVQLASLRHLALSRCYQINLAALADLVKLPQLRTLEVFGLGQDTFLPELSKALPRVQINMQCFSTVARPTPADRKDCTLWGIRCRLAFRWPECCFQ